jgi:hypothetical protein
MGGGMGSHNPMTGGPLQHHLPNGSLNLGAGSHAGGGMPGQFPGGHLSSRVPDMPPRSHSGGGAGQFSTGGSSHVGHASTWSSRSSGSWGGGRPSGSWGGGSSGPRFSGSVSRGPVSGGFRRR